MAKQSVLLNKIEKENNDYIMEVDRGLSTEYFYHDSGKYYSVVINTEEEEVDQS